MALTAEVWHSPDGYRCRCSCGTITKPAPSIEDARSLLLTHWATHNNHT